MQSVQELFFVTGTFIKLFTVMIWLRFFACDVQQELKKLGIFDVHTMLPR